MSILLIVILLMILWPIAQVMLAILWVGFLRLFTFLMGVK
jgi:hypothetical protein